MYESFFHLKQKPFDLAPNPQFLFLSRTHRKALNYLEYGLQDQSGFMLLTGEVGSGKTTLIRHCMRGLSSLVTVARIFNTRINPDQLLAMINEDFGLASSGKDKVMLLGELYDFLIAEYERGRRALLIIDEGQNLTYELLEEVRLLSNLETDETKLLQILLAGQPELAKKIAQPVMRQLRQRIGFICNLSSLSRRETEEYVFHRMEVAGNRKALHFAPKAMDAVHTYSGGIPRLINTICNLLVLTAFAEERREVDADMVREVGELLAEATAPLAEQPDLAGRRALLEALGVPIGGRSVNDGHEEEADPASGVSKTINELNMRLKTLEHEFSRFGRPETGERR